MPWAPRAQHPNMFAAVIADAGVMDLLRYPLFTIGVPLAAAGHRPVMCESLRTCLASGSACMMGPATPSACVRGDHPCPCTRPQVLCARSVTFEGCEHMSMRTKTVCDPQCRGKRISAVLRTRRQSSARTHRSSDVRPARQMLAGSDARARACAQARRGWASMATRPTPRSSPTCWPPRPWTT